MSDQATRAETAVDAARPAFARRASNVFLLGAVVSLLALLIVFAAADDRTPPVLFALTVLEVVAMGVTSLVLSFALDRGRPWAPTAAVIVLWIALIGGLVGAVMALTQASVRVPLDSILAAWALAAHDRPRTLSFSPGRSRIAAFTGVMLLAQLATPLAVVATTPGISPLVVGRDALETRITAGCPPPGGPWSAIPVAFDWHWSSGEPWPMGPDAVAIAVGDTIGDARGYAWQDLRGPAGSTEGGRGRSGDLIEQQPIDGISPWWTIDAGAIGLVDDGASAVLVPLADAPTGAGTITFVAYYAHDGAWLASDEVTCAW